MKRKTNKIKSGNGECVNETSYQTKSRKNAVSF